MGSGTGLQRYRRERIDSLKAEKAEIARRLAAAPLLDRPALVERQTAIADALYREEEEDNPSATWEHRDPADRTIVATATMHNLPIVTKDSSITDLYDRVIW